MDSSMASVQKHPSITKQRVEMFLQDGQWKDVNINSVLYDVRFSGEPHVKMEVWSAPEQSRPTFDHASQQSFSAIEPGHTFGTSWTSHWVRVTIMIPKEMEGRQVRFLFDPGCEAMVWSVAGEPLQGITGGDKQCLHVDHILTNKATAENKEHVLYYEVACNGLFGNGAFIIGPPDPSCQFKLLQAELVVLNKAAWAMKSDLGILLDMYNTLPKSSPRAWEALYTANAMINAFDPEDKKSMDKALKLGSEFFAKRGGDSNHQVFAIGNCHIDTAWLWPYDETKRKIARSWSTQMDYMDRYPEYKFAASQAQQFEWLRTLYPSLFKRVQEKVKTGQFIPIGGTWIEMDCNIPNGESLVRQFLLGQGFFEKHFNVRSTVFWLPDTFGYSPQLPQIIRLAGAKYFFTQKLSWNNINTFPHTTFRWVGLDGTHVLTHMAPANTYTATAVAKEIIESVGRHKDVAYTNESMYLYGNGDGGGGPLEGMLDRLDRMKDLDGLPRVKHADPSDFYEHVEKTNKGLVNWKGELYLEFHRGTYTSQAKTKKFNRQSEMLLRDVEMLSAIAKNGAFGFAYPAKELERLWRIVCLNQFHDVIPGSSIEMVYKDTDKLYADVVASAVEMKQNALAALFHNVSVGSSDAATGMLFVNTTAWPRTEVVAVQGLGHEGVQQFRQEDGSALVVATSVPGLGVGVVDLDNASTDAVPVSVFTDSCGNIVLENLYIAAKISKQGHLVSLWDKNSEREVVAEGQKGNVFYLQEDTPIFWDAWDIEIYSDEKKKELAASSVVVVDEGPLVASVCVEVQVGKQSKLRQWVSLSATSPRLDFACNVDWHENRKCLRVSFTWDIYNDMAIYETQFGVVQRPTHRNTSWDMAKFEVCAQRFADLSEYGYGVALLNDCKYGYSTLENTMSLTLLRAPKSPDASCDMGNHTFRYAVYPHKGTFSESDVVQEAYKFNVPLVQLPVDYALAESAQNSPSDVMACLGLSGASNVVLDTVKLAEDSSNSVVVRMYEAYGGHARARLTTRLNVTAAEKTNILEEKIGDLKLEPAAAAKNGGKGKSVDIQFKPFEIVTVKLSVKK
ncbi:Glycoside hydrolase, 38 vacuolar alpha mannosidase [Coemansia sp. RSA 1813]|nr:Glycoside hydrolase, 38 vacuolar alpha mannosidase [Coemansia sp. RSA 1646]KAJ1771389.1 Glycoside hydrolase, 38 vacuolar alpha mannosidase [Coemansia sp. RSA 1843]KAJ2093162.1 Glycoside hydrolase, 38 vacuolar alpha mannosidase [Coemansia sp. RSA 986]KAJ2217572.1 Glycoside hydrolase, 38 vacuolar alpha mannosidase [Coemansia sp. RSA 487]KAJ2573416.1 Glycoside hydrolase, 38 vacuolar alpha mannosidase [Coemansia sp. RSA 1813]